MVDNIFELEKNFHALDDGAFDGPGGSLCLDGLIARNIGRSSNAMLLSGQQILNLIYPTQGVLSDGAETMMAFSGEGSITFLCKSMPVPKKPHLREGTLKIRHRVATSMAITYAVGTLVSPLPEGKLTVSNLAVGSTSKKVRSGTVAGTGGWATVTIDGIPLHQGTMESITIAAWTSGWGSVETNTSAYGSPLHGATSNDPFNVDSFMRDYQGGTYQVGGIYDASATWQSGTGLLSDNLAHGIVFTDASGGAISNVKRIVFVHPDGTKLAFDSFMSNDEANDVLISGQAYAQIVQLDHVEIACATLVAKGITASAF